MLCHEFFLWECAFYIPWSRCALSSSMHTTLAVSQSLPLWRFIIYLLRNLLELLSAQVQAHAVVVRERSTNAGRQ